MKLTKEIHLSNDFNEIRHYKIDGSSSKTLLPTGINFTSNSATESAWGAYFLYCEPNSVVEVSFEARQDVNSNGKIGINSNSSDAVTGTLLDFVKPNSDDWKAYKLSHPIKPGDNYCYVNFGVYSADIGSIDIRNMIIRVYNSELQNPAIVGGVIRKIGTSWSIHNSAAGFTSNGLLSVEPIAGTTRVKVNYTPIKSWSRPIINFSLSDSGAGASIASLTVSGINNGVFELSAYKFDGTAFDLVNGSGDVYIHLMLLGF